MAVKPTYEELEQRVRELEQAETERRQVRIALRESEARYRELVDFSPLPLLVTQEERIVFVNPAAIQLFGVKDRDAILASSPMDWIRSDYGERAYQRRRRAIETGAYLKPAELILVREDGKELVVLANATRVFHRGSPALLSVFQDITEGKRTEEALQESRKELRLFVDSTPDFCFLKDPEGRYLMVNAANARFFGKEESEILGRTDFDLMSEEAAQGCTWTDQRAMETGRKVLDTEQVGERVYETCKMPVFSEKEVVGVAGIIRDVTEVKQAEEALRREEEKFRSLVENVADWVWQMDGDGVFTYVSPQSERSLGYAVSEILGKTPFHFMARAEAVRVRAVLRDVFFRRVRISEQENTLLAKDGLEVVFETNATPLFDVEGAFIGYMGTSRDVTGRKRAEAERRQLEARLRETQKMEAIGTLAGGIAHDFNNILSVILGNVEMVMHDLPEWTAAREGLQEVREASLRARDLVTQILFFARQKEHTISSIRVEAIARDSLKMLRATIPTTVEIHQQIEADLPAVFADPVQIQQIIMNLCTNAGHAMEADGGTMTFTLDAAELETALDTLTGRIPEGRYVRIQVRDMGPGIAPEAQGRVFEPFFTTKSVGEGTGLGLAVVHGIVQDRAGGISFDSEPGKGTTFTVFLPASDEGMEAEPARENSAPAKGIERVLFVDDEPMIRKLGQRILERQGYQVETRPSGVDALECFREHPDRFDVVVTDMTMPGMRGDRLAEEILSIRPEIPVILSTGYSKQVSEEKAGQIGVRAFVMKPLTGQELADTVRRVLDTR